MAMSRLRDEQTPASPAVPTVARAVVATRAQEGRPVRLGEPHLRVRALPQQETGKALLTGRADDQVRVGLTGRIQIFGDHLDGDRVDQLLGCGTVSQLFAEQRANRVGDLLSAAVGDRDVDVEGSVPT